METTPLRANLGLMWTLGAPGGAPPFLGENLGLMWGLAAPSLHLSPSILGFKAPAGLLAALRSPAPNLRPAATHWTQPRLLRAPLADALHSANSQEST